MFAINLLSHADIYSLCRCKFTFALVDRPFHGWSGQLWKERLNFSKIAKFESDTSQVSEDIAPPCKVPKIYRRLYCGGGGGGVLGAPPPPPIIQTSVKVLTLRSSIFVSFLQITLVFKLGNCTNLEADFPYDLSMSKVE